MRSPRLPRLPRTEIGLTAEAALGFVACPGRTCVPPAGVWCPRAVEIPVGALTALTALVGRPYPLRPPGRDRTNP
ncbi:hypothetical protein [Streptomyces sp. 303MFCol5.2]|uniref:hypothetical protein n=1 Tax=Streptomyces sp. 303MFCol5.2 TaxID=1172181 RepID=UPI0003742AF4|nr:hypothetical protein [Streptomyces sp. 303MFCol5.2]